VRIDDERDLHEQLEAAFGAITPAPAPVDGAVRRGRVIKARRRAAVAAGAAAVVALAVLSVPAQRHGPAAPGPVTQAGHYAVTVQAPGPHAAPGLIASGTIDGKGWQLTAAKPGSGAPGTGSRGQMFTTSGAAFGGAATAQPGQALTVYSQVPVWFSDSVLTRGPVQVQYGAVRADVTYVAARLDNGTVLILHPVAVYGVRAVAFAVPVGARIVDATAYSRHGQIATATPFNAPNGVAFFGLWLRPGQHGLARTSGRIGSGTAYGGWSATAYLGPWGVCIRVPATGITSAQCTPAASPGSAGLLFYPAGKGLSVMAGQAPPGTGWIVVNQPDGTTTKRRPVTVGSQSGFFAIQVLPGPHQMTWSELK